MIKLWIGEPVYGTDTLFLSDCTHEEVVNYLKKEWNHEIDYQHTANGQMITIRRGRTVHRIVWIKELSANPYWVGVAAHEVFHLIVRVCYRVGIPIRDSFQETGENADEAAAYLHEFYLQRYLEEVEKIINKKKNANKRTTKGRARS